MSDGTQTGVEVKLSFFFGAFLLLLCTPKVEIDGTVHKKYWGTHFFPTTPGKHSVKVYFRYLVMSHCGANSIDLTVADGSVVRIKYFMWPWIFAKGSLKIVN